jgi:hypothetical protein
MISGCHTLLAQACELRTALCLPRRLFVSLTLETNNQQKLSYGMCMENMIDALNDCTTGRCP